METAAGVQSALAEPPLRYRRRDLGHRLSDPWPL